MLFSDVLYEMYIINRKNKYMRDSLLVPQTAAQISWMLRCKCDLTLNWAMTILDTWLRKLL